MTTENVAVLFTDMVGSTALGSGLSPDAARFYGAQLLAVAGQRGTTADMVPLVE